jgi:hypothetical protein
MLSPLPQSVGLNRQVFVEGRRIPGLQRPVTDGLNLSEVTLIGGVEWGGGRRSNLVKDSTARDIFLANFSD